MESTPKRKVLDFVREWVTPILLTIVGLFIWRDLSELRSDVKQLLIQQSSDRMQIEQIQYDVNALKACVFKETANYPKKEKKIKDLSQNTVGLKEDELKIEYNEI